MQQRCFSPRWLNSSSTIKFLPCQTASRTAFIRHIHALLQLVSLSLYLLNPFSGVCKFSYFLSWTTAEEDSSLLLSSDIFFYGASARFRAMVYPTFFHQSSFPCYHLPVPYLRQPYKQHPHIICHHMYAYLTLRGLNQSSKVKAIPLQACTGPEGSRRLRLPDFKTIGTWKW